VISLKKILFLFSFSEKQKLFLLIFLTIIMALMDMIGIASILPFIGLLTNPNLIETNNIISTIYKYGNFDNSYEFLFFIGLAIFILFIISLIFKVTTIYFQLRFGLMREYTISKYLVEGYIKQPYSWFLNQNSSDLSKNILSEVSKVVSGCVLPFIELISQSIVTIVILSMLLFIDFTLTINIGLIFGFLYFFIFRIVRKFLDKIGIERLEANKSRFKLISEIFGGFKEIKLGGFEKYFLNKFSQPAKIYSKNLAYSEITARVPRFILEAFAFGGILLITLFLIKTNDNFISIVPVVALYTFAGYRLMPAVQSVYFSYAQIRFSKPALDLLYKDISDLEFSINEKKIKFKSSFKLEDKIIIENINFSHKNLDKFKLSNVNMSIPVKNTIGIVGETGGGKTTIANILLGLLIPDSGFLKIDGKTIDKTNLRSWQKVTGYVPQQIFLTDDTVAANIAFGSGKEEIDYNRLRQVADIANIRDFIENELPKQYETKIGENGVRISGGQRQRIGIARALYYNPQFLIFDEATSSLDNISEKLIIDSIFNIRNQTTVLMIAHRLSTIKLCQKIYHVSEGKIINSGSFKELSENDEKFKKMINI
jgi:ABC-type multidrug transport system fused ATPase/permease subunit